MGFKKVNISKIKKNSKELQEKSLPLFSITKNGIDVLVNKHIKGHWKGFLFSQLREDPEGRKLLYWVVRSAFPDRVREIAQELIDGA